MTVHPGRGVGGRVRAAFGAVVLLLLLFGLHQLWAVHRVLEQEEAARERLTSVLVELDSLTRAVVAGAEHPSRLVALDRHYAELAEGEAAASRRRLVRLSALLLGLLLAGTAGVGLFLARSLDREAAVRAREAEKAARASAYKTWFIGHVSHEFRTPLSSIVGFTSFLANSHGALPEARRAEYLDIVLRNARHLLHVINDILNLSKVEAGTLEVTLAPLYTTEVVTAVVTSLRPQAEERGIRIRSTDHSRHRVTADAGRLRQVLFNLLENAVKYSPPGAEVEIRVSSGAGEVRIEIVDQGPGIAPEHRPRLFKEFSRIQPRGTKVAGAGLGLALSKRLVELMRGKIGVDTAPGEGSTFWVELPSGGEILSSVRPEVFLPGPAARERTETVAVVDDDPDIRAYAAAILEHAGYRVAADDGETGTAGRLAPLRPDLLLLDLNLRARSGLDALHEIRATPALSGVPVVAFTATSGEEVAELLEGGGFRGHLLKPVEPDALLECVDSLLDAGPAPSAPPEPSAPEAEDPDFLAPLRARFRSGLGGRLHALEDARERGEVEEFAREAHKLKGAAAGYGMGGLSAAAAAAEEGVRGEGGSLADPAVDALLAHLREVVAAPTA